MTRGNFKDPEWRQVLPILCFFVVIPQFWLHIGATMYYPADKAPVPDLSDASPAYGFHIRGNLSFFSDAVAQRVDTNESSPTFGMWTPPPEWRDYCIETSGVPLSACSYFMYEEYPTFMSFFYIMMLILFLIEVVIRFSAIYCRLLGPKSITRALMAHEDDCGDAFTPWGCQKNPNCRQTDFYPFVFLGVGIFCLLQWSDVVYTIWGPGIGLVHSIPSGKLYLGADWNNFPVYQHIESPGQYSYMDMGMFYLEEKAERETHWSRGLYWFLYPWTPRIWGYWYCQQWPVVAQSFMVMYIHGVAPWVTDIMGIFIDACPTLLFLLFLSTKTEKKDETFGKFGQDNFFTTVNHWSCKGVYVAFKNWFAMGWGAQVWLFLYFLVQYYPTWTMQSLHHIIGNDQALRLQTFVNSGNVALTCLVCIVSMGLVTEFMILGKMKSKFMQGKNLMSDAMHNARMAKFNTMQKCYRTFFITLVCLFTPVLMPQGMAMQQFGMRDLASWPSPMNFFFGVPGQAANMLAAPLHRLVLRAFMMLMWFKYFSSYLFENNRHKAQPPLFYDMPCQLCTSKTSNAA